MTSSLPTIYDAEDAIRRRITVDGFTGRLEYARDKVIENTRWWYIPFSWIGCGGFIVNKHDRYVNWLGSGLTLEECFWGHDHGIFCDLVDFAFSPQTDKTLAARLLLKFKHTLPNALGLPPGEPVWYRDSEVTDALANQFPTFNRHFVWNCIPEIHHAFEHEGLRFTCGISTSHAGPS